MAKLVVAIEVPQCTEEELRKEVYLEPWKYDWFSPEDGGRIVVDEAFLQKAICDDSFYAFELIDIRP